MKNVKKILLTVMTALIMCMSLTACATNTVAIEEDTVEQITISTLVNGIWKSEKYEDNSKVFETLKTLKYKKISDKTAAENSKTSYIRIEITYKSDDANIPGSKLLIDQSVLMKTTYKKNEDTSIQGAYTSSVKYTFIEYKDDFEAAIKKMLLG